MNITKPGIYQIPMVDYLADPCPVPSISSGLAHTIITRSPRHAWCAHPRLNPDYVCEQAEVMDIGSLAHSLLLEQSDDPLVEIDPKDYPSEPKKKGEAGSIPAGWTNKAIRAARDAARDAGKLPILKDDAKAVREMVAVAREYIASSELAGIFDTGAPELTIAWQEGDVWCRARPDWLTADRSFLLHYKTTQRSAEPDSVSRGLLVGMGYDMAAAFYERGLHAVARPRKHTSVFLVQECAPPYGCSLIALSPELLDFADAKVTRAINAWRNCSQSGVWPVYPTRICWAEPPVWAQKQWEEREALTEYDPEVALEP